MFLTRQSRLHHALTDDFARRDYGRWTWMIRPCGPDSDLDAILREPDVVLAEKAQIIKTSDSSRIGRFAGYVIKRWGPHGMGALLKDWVRGPRARRAGLNALEVARAGIPTPQPVAWGTARNWGLQSVSFLIMEDVTGAVDLGQCKGDRLCVSGQCGALIGRLHDQGFTHRDLKPSNLLIAPDGSPVLIDMDGLRRPGSVSRGGAISDLVKLARRMVEVSTLSPREAARFVEAYAAARGALPRRGWWRDLKGEAFRHREFHPRK